MRQPAAEVARAGFDARPLNTQSEDDVRWLRACIWPGDSERLARFEAAVTAMRAALKRPAPPTLERCSASLVPERLSTLLSGAPRRTLLLAYQTLVSGYLDDAERQRYERGMRELILRNPAGSAVWLELELDDARRKLPASLVAHVRVGETVKSLTLATCTQHPRELELKADNVAAFRRHLAQT